MARCRIIDIYFYNTKIIVIFIHEYNIKVSELNNLTNSKKLYNHH